METSISEKSFHFQNNVYFFPDNFCLTFSFFRPKSESENFQNLKVEWRHITSLLGFENFPFQENTNTKTIASKSRSVTAKT